MLLNVEKWLNREFLQAHGRGDVGGTGAVVVLHRGHGLHVGGPAQRPTRRPSQGRKGGRR